MSSEKKQKVKWHVEARLYNKGEKEPYTVTTLSVMAADPDDAAAEATTDVRAMLEQNNPDGDFKFLTIRQAPPRPVVEDPTEEEMDEDCAGA